MTTQRGKSRSGARWGWLLTTLALGVALATASWANYRSAREAVSTLDLGQVRVFESVVVNALRASLPGGSPPDLDSLVAAQAEAGLRFVGLFSPEEGLTTLGGTPMPDPIAAPRLEGGPQPVRIGDRIRTFVPGPRPPGPARSGPGRPDELPAQVPADPQAGPDRGSRSVLMIEFEPLVSGRLLARATRFLILGSAAAGLLMLTAGLFWRATLRQEADQRIMAEQRRLSTLGELSAVLAHEIRNPLASLKGHAQLLAERTDGDAPERTRVERIVTEAQRLEDLTNDLLDFVRTGPLDLAPVALGAFLQGMVSAAGDVNVHLDASRAPERWVLDAQRIRQVMVNLTDNAVAASPEGATINVTAIGEGSSLVVTFQDEGEGIAEENADRIFEPFFTTRTKGTGLGLAVARRIVELHGGSLTARSVPGGGAEFRVTLPEGNA